MYVWLYSFIWKEIVTCKKKSATQENPSPTSNMIVSIEWNPDLYSKSPPFQEEVLKKKIPTFAPPPPTPTLPTSDVAKVPSFPGMKIRSS